MPTRTNWNTCKSHIKCAEEKRRGEQHNRKKLLFIHCPAHDCRRQRKPLFAHLNFIYMWKCSALSTRIFVRVQSSKGEERFGCFNDEILPWHPTLAYRGRTKHDFLCLSLWWRALQKLWNYSEIWNVKKLVGLLLQTSARHHQKYVFIRSWRGLGWTHLNSAVLFSCEKVVSRVT